MWASPPMKTGSWNSLIRYEWVLTKYRTNITNRLEGSAPCSHHLNLVCNTFSEQHDAMVWHCKTWWINKRRLKKSQYNKYLTRNRHQLYWHGSMYCMDTSRRQIKNLRNYIDPYISLLACSNGLPLLAECTLSQHTKTYSEVQSTEYKPWSEMEYEKFTNYNSGFSDREGISLQKSFWFQ